MFFFFLVRVGSRPGTFLASRSHGAPDCCSTYRATPGVRYGIEAVEQQTIRSTYRATPGVRYGIEAVEQQTMEASSASSGAAR